MGADPMPLLCNTEKAGTAGKGSIRGVYSETQVPRIPPLGSSVKRHRGSLLEGVDTSHPLSRDSM